MRERGTIAAYIIASQRNGTLYTGVTSNLIRRISQHKNGDFDGFSKKYGCKMLVWYEVHDSVTGAIRHEKRLKGWLRAWKLKLIEDENPLWRDLAYDLVDGWDEVVEPVTDALSPLSQP
jgi:putative endonuclease